MPIGIRSKINYINLSRKMMLNATYLLILVCFLKLRFTSRGPYRPGEY
jgi:hypothetical protein